MNNKTILQEAFKQFELLEEETFHLDNSEESVEDAKEFMDASDALDMLDVIDPEAETEEEVEDSYTDKVILDCNVCHSKIYKDPSEIVISDDKECVNKDEECPFCYSMDGYKIIGQVKPFVEDDFDITVEPKEEETSEEGDAEVEEDATVVEESYKRRSGKSLRESRKRRLKESISDELTRTLDLAFNKHHPVLVTTNPGLGTIARVKEWAKNHARNPIYIDAKGMDPADIGGVVDNGKAYRLSNDEPIMKMKNASPQDIFILDEINRVDPSIRAALLDAINHCKGFVISVVVNNSNYPDELDAAERSKFIEVNVDKSSSMTESRKRRSRRLKEGWYGDYVGWDFIEEACIDDDLKWYNSKEEFIDSLMDFFEEYRGPLEDDGVDFDEIPDYLSNFWDNWQEEYGELSESLENIDLETSHDRIHIEAEEKPESDDEMLAPLEPEMEDEIENNQEEIEEEPTEGEEEIDYDIDDFDEETFDDLGESYLRNVYENVNSFRTSRVTEKGNKWIVEGRITFNSGNTKPTKFIFEAFSANKKGKLNFIGENAQISRGKKSFKLSGVLDNKKFISESLNYNYRQKDAAGKSVRVYGTVKC